MEDEIKRDGEFSYSSTQLDLNSTDAQQIQDFLSAFIIVDDLHDYGIEEQSHITVLYGLHDQLPININRVLMENQVKPITVMLGKTSIFDTGAEYDVVKIDVISGDLRKLNKLLLNNLEVTNSYPVYVPHLTLAYVWKGEGEKYVGNNTFEGKLITFDRLTFSPSDGMEDTYIYFEQ